MANLRLLLTNDDGIDAPGLSALAEAVNDLGEITIIAPDRNRSGASNSLTIDAPLRVKQLSNNRLRIEGTPTDCVHLGITGLLPQLPDMVIAGINEGSNLGDDVWYSGTVAAAMEGRFLGLPAMAVSLQGDSYKYYDTAGKIVRELIQEVVERPLPASTILNINVPDVPYEELLGLEVTRLGTRHRAEPTVCELDPRGHPIYWVGPAGAEQDAGPGTDFYAISRKKVSMTPLRVDLTHYEAFEQLSQWVKKLESAFS